MRVPVLAILLVALLAACTSEPPPEPPEPPDPLDQALRAAPPEQVFRGVLGGTPVHLAVHDCEVFIATGAPRGQPAWERVLAPEPYPFFTSCQRQWLEGAGAAGVRATLGRQALGAGGCCASGGRYRSSDGRHWVRE